MWRITVGIAHAIQTLNPAQTTVALLAAVVYGWFLWDNCFVNTTNLTGHLLIALPNMADPNFSRSVTYICEHHDHGALGLIINRPTEMDYQTLFEQIDLDLSQSPLAKQPVYFGGPVQADRGFVLHQPIGQWGSTIAVTEDIALTTSKDILHAVAQGQTPQNMLLALGYAGWSAGQLEEELAQNAWLTVKASPKFIFDTPNNKKFDAALALLGVNLANLSEDVGHA